MGGWGTGGKKSSKEAVMSPEMQTGVEEGGEEKEEKKKRMVD